MTGFVDPADEAATRDALRVAVRVLGPVGLLEQLGSVLPVRLGRPAAFLRRAEPTVLLVDDEALSTDGRRVVLQHVVGGVALSSDEVRPGALPEVLARLLLKAVTSDPDRRDPVSVVLTSLRDAVRAAGG